MKTYLRRELQNPITASRISLAFSEQGSQIFLQDTVEVELTEEQAARVEAAFREMSYIQTMLSELWRKAARGSKEVL